MPKTFSCLLLCCILPVTQFDNDKAKAMHILFLLTAHETYA